MSYRYNRQEVDSAIELLAELYPKCFFLDPGHRRPLQNGIVADLVKDGVQVTHDLLRAAIDWYQSHFGYQLALQTGAKRIDLNGKEVGTVTKSEYLEAQKYIHDHKQEKREQERTANPIVTKIVKPIVTTKQPIPTTMEVKDVIMPVKAPQPNDPLAPIQALLDAVRTAFTQPEPLQRPFAIAGLRVVMTEIEKLIKTMEPNGERK
jgi:ProP effector